MAMDLILATAGFDHTIRLWHPHNATCFRKLQHANSQVNQLAISNDGKQLGAAGYEHVRLYDITSPSPYPTTTYSKLQKEKNVTSLGFNPSSQWMFTAGEEGLACVWDLRTSQCQRKLKISSAINSAVLHPDQAQLLLASQDGECIRWDLRTDKQDVFYSSRCTSVHSIAVNIIATQIAALDSKGSLLLWDTNDLTTISAQSKPHLARGLKVTFSRDCKYLATTASDKCAKISSAEADTLLDVVTVFSVEEQKWVWDAVFSASSRYLFTASSDGTVRLWDREKPNTPKQEYMAHQKAVVSIAFWDKEDHVLESDSIIEE